MFKNKTGIIQKIRKSRAFKGACMLVLLSMIFEIAQPTVSLALTEGPSQPEVQSFEPIGTTQMVDLFSGDFNYNIPLFNLPGPNGGYPVNLAYHAGSTMDDEASWVGLGWNINVGSLVRDVRGLPDDFKTTSFDGEQASASGDHLLIKQDHKPNRTLGGSFSVSPELFGADWETVASLSLSVYHNNYRGIGLSVGAGLSFDNSPFDLGLSLDGENGLGVTATIKNKNTVIEDCTEKQTTSSHSISLNFDGNLSMGYSLKKSFKELDNSDLSKDGRGRLVDSGSSSSFGTGHSFSLNSFSPTVGSRSNNNNITIGFSGGPELNTGFFAKNSFSVSYNWESLDPIDQAGRRTPVIGYERNGAVGDNYLRDYARMNDGQITRASIFLANSNYLFDTYNSTGQGLSGYFRSRRNDIGKVGNESMINNSQGINLGLEFGAGLGASKFGIDPGVNWGSNQSGFWNTDNDLSVDFDDPDLGGINEVMYYQAHGEQTILHPFEYDHINGLDLATAYFTPKVNDGLHNGKRKIENEEPANEWYNSSRKHDAIGDRVVRNTLVHALKNIEVAKLGEFKVSFYSLNSDLYQPAPSNNALRRDFRKMSNDQGGESDINISNHNAGFKVLNQEGSYYVYGLPAYNLKEVENTFSSAPLEPGNRTYPFLTEGTEVKYQDLSDNSYESIHKTTKTPYAHSYLLTSVLGADYIDLANDGPSDDDMGYWVKFDYIQASQKFNWRAPYYNNMGQVNAGAAYMPDDDQLSYQYGEKEIWHLGRIETKTHIALFILDEVARKDGKEANGEHPGNENGGGEHAKRLKEIRVYDKKSFSASATPIQVVHFEHEYSLCKNLQNSSEDPGSETSGKLTLTKIWFESQGSTRGELSKYQFEYAGTGNNPGINPDYTYGAYDAWGNYRPTANSAQHQMRFPYTNQFNQDFLLPSANFYGGNTLQNAAAKDQTKLLQDNYASAWCLSRIKLPSGGTININYESDDYGYVQHKTANQMFKITKLGDYTEPNELYNTGEEDYYDTQSTNDEARRRIYFKLEKPLPAGQSHSQTIYNDYVDPIIQDETGNRNLYFKSRVRLTRTPDVYEYISGYLPLEPYSATNYGVASQTATIDGESCYTHGFVTIQATKKKHKENGNTVYFPYHPISLVSWTFLQTDAPRLLNNPNSFSSMGDMDANQVLGQVTDLLNVVPNLASSFGAIRPYCKSKDMARFIDLNASCIRLASPDKIKYGGGHRVKEISITDNWADDTGVSGQTRTYGQQFDYTTTETKNGITKTISSGVTQYEPMAGGDENALKYPINYYDKQTIFSRNNLFAEAPMNEALFPGPSVGYRKVTVKSLNTRDQQRNNTDGNPSTNPVGRTGGIEVHEFYTAKEFPTIVKWSDLKEENSTKEVFLLPIIVPFVGSLKRNYFYGSQSYLIELNDMHGKPKSTSSYELNNYVAGVNPITYAEYEYQAKNIVYQQEQVFQLDNNVAVIPDNETHAILKTGNAVETRLMGVETELYTDQREFVSKNNDFALDFNLDMPFPFLAGVTFWPTVNNSKNMFRTYVTNKVIHRTGILKRTKTRDLQTVNESEIVAYDEKSGIPLLTKIKNEFGDDFYNYNIPAYYAYDRMGHAYRNINYTFNASVQYPVGITPAEDGSNYLEFDGTNQLNYLVRGDELLILDAHDDNADIYKKVYFLGWKYDGGVTKGILHSPFSNILTTGSGSEFKLKVIRSGRRNNFGTSIANYLTKGKLEDHIKLPNGQIDLQNVDATDNTIKTPQIKANTVLSATASVFRDDWSTSVQSDLNNDLVTENPFLTGNSGIWRPYKSYTYVGPRKTSADMSNNSNSSTDPNLKEDGVFMDPIKMFTWDLGNIEDYVANWEWVNEITRYSPDAYELENRNRLGVYSSALYGYNNSLSIGVAGNATYNEVGVADFELFDEPEYDFLKLLSQTNLNFDNNHSASNNNNLITVQYDFEKAIVNGAFIDFDLASNPSIPSSFPITEGDVIGMSITSRKTSGVLGNIGSYFNGYIRKSGGGSFSVVPFLRRDLIGEKLVPDGGVYHGVITFFMKRAHVAINNGSISYPSTKAHTGKKSMLIRNNLDVTFDQPRLKFAPDGTTKSYVLSMWISRANENQATYRPSSGNVVEVGKMVSGSFNSLSNNSIVTYGKIVEGWQKVDVEFKWTSNEASAVPAIRIISGNENLYVDDIRISPKTGGLATYVYDPVKYWLSASLNVDNYATFFYYDEEGNLHLKKQETEKGIFTISESRGHVSKSQ